MYNTSDIRSLSIESVLTSISEYQIFEYYMGRSFKIGEVFSSPLREDKKPSFAIYNSSGKMSLRYKDFSTGENGTCFNFIQKKFNCTLYEALRIVNNDFKLKLSTYIEFDTEKKANIVCTSGITYVPNIKETKIEVAVRDWNSKEDKDYWSSHGITAATLNKYKVYPLKQVWITKDKTLNLYATKANPIYGYYFGDNKWKIYRPYGGDYKWYSNTTRVIVQGLEQLNYSREFLVITKSLKEVMLMDDLDISAIAPQSESTLLSLKDIEYLKSKFNRIFINFDFDHTGVCYGNFYKNYYGFEPLYITNGKYNTVDYKVKDLSDYCKLYGIKKTRLLVNSTKKTLKL